MCLVILNAPTRYLPPLGNITLPPPASWAALDAGKQASICKEVGGGESADLEGCLDGQSVLCQAVTNRSKLDHIKDRLLELLPRRRSKNLLITQ